jgi:pyruvate,water dikinase
VTVSCAEGDTGQVYAGALDFEVRELQLDQMPPLPFKIMMNVGNPDRAFDFQFLPNAGVGLARLEFIINRMIGIHPKALLNYADLPDDLRASIARRIAGYADPVGFYVDKLAEGVSTLAAAFWPKPVIVRLSDFKSNEYANLLGGERYEPDEENPMLGFRGASRYVAESFRDCFELECRAMRKVRDQMGLTNVEVMIPFVRTVDEARAVVDLLAANGLRRGENGLRLIMMCEIPSNALLAEEFLDRLERPDPTDPGAGPRLRRDRPSVRRAQPGGQGAAVDGDPGLPPAGQIHRHLRSGALGSSRPGPLADERRHREHIVEPRLGAGDLALPGGRRGLVSTVGTRRPAVDGT